MKWPKRRKSLKDLKVNNYTSHFCFLLVILQDSQPTSLYLGALQYPLGLLFSGLFWVSQSQVQSSTASSSWSSLSTEDITSSSTPCFFKTGTTLQSRWPGTPHLAFQVLGIKLYSSTPGLLSTSATSHPPHVYLLFILAFFSYSAEVMISLKYKLPHRTNPSVFPSLRENHFQWHWCGFYFQQGWKVSSNFTYNTAHKQWFWYPPSLHGKQI